MGKPYDVSVGEAPLIQVNCIHYLGVSMDSGTCYYNVISRVRKT